MPLLKKGENNIPVMRIHLFFFKNESFLKTDPCPYLVICSPDVLKKKIKVLDIFNTDKNCFRKTNIESSSQDI